jgi:type I restriction enzyme R subunit
MRPVFSTSDFVQIKGRGTRKWTFEYDNYRDISERIEKSQFKFFDYFATCEFFENDFDYDEKIKLPNINSGSAKFEESEAGKVSSESLDLAKSDQITSIQESANGVIMRIDREGFKKAMAEDVLGDETLAALWKNGDFSSAEDYVRLHVFDKPKNFLNLDRVRKIFNVDRRISVKEFLEVAFGERDSFESKDELLESEWQKFMAIHRVDQDHYQPVKNFFKAFIIDQEVRDIVRSRQLARFHHCASFDFSDYEQLNGFKSIVPQYINDYAYRLTGI